MKTLSSYKASYKNAKRSEAKARIMNSAMLNLSYEDQQKFMKFQVAEMNK